MLSIVDGRLVIDAPLTMQEYLMKESVPLALIFRVVFDCLRSRPGTVVYGSQALNAYVSPPRMTEDIDVFAQDAPVLADEICCALHDALHLAIRVRRVQGGFRVYQATKESRRHLVDIRPAQDLPPSQLMGDISFVTPSVLAAMKILAATQRAHLPTRHQDTVDVERLLERYPGLKKGDGVEKLLRDFQATEEAHALWASLRSTPTTTQQRKRDESRPVYRRTRTRT
jgi:hypothetical protein